MIIERVEIFHLRTQLEQPFAFSQWTFHQRETTLCAVTTTCGRTGWGEAYGPPPPIAAALEHLLSPLVIGRDPRDVETLWDQLYARFIDYSPKGAGLAALSALDIAFWDLRAQSMELPLYRCLGASETEAIPCYATGFYFGQSRPLEDQFREEAALYRDQGFRAMKLKVGLGPARDAALVRIVRESVGPDIRLMIDANHRYWRAEAFELARRVEEFDLTWFEEPISPQDIEGHRDLRNRTRIPLAGGECEATRHGFAHWFQSNALDYVQPDLCQCGGITEGWKIAVLASVHGVHLTPHVWGTAIGQSAALHFYAARPRAVHTVHPETKLIENDRTEYPLREGIFSKGLDLRDGQWRLPRMPGLGVEIDRNKLHPFVVAHSAIP